MSSDSLSSARSLARLWQAALGRLELELAPYTYQTWLHGTRALRLDGTTLVIEARSALGCEWLNDRLAHAVRRAVASANEGDFDVRFVPRGTGVEPRPVLEAPPAAAAAPNRAAIVGALNCTFTFERYLETVSNRMAFRSCLALLEGDEGGSNPLVLHGAPGMGKTHLLHAVACAASEAGRTVACLSAEDFTNRFVSALRRDNAGDFQLSMRSVSLLALDDLQFLAGKKATQDELVHTIDAIVHAGGQVIVASESHPLDLNLPDRLATRLGGGLVVGIDPFPQAERRRFVEWLCQLRRASLPAWAIDRIAAIDAPSARLLQGAVNAALALGRLGTLEPGRLDAELARIGMTEAGASAATVQAILDAVARHFAVDPGEIAGRSRRGPIADARSVSAAALRARGHSLSAVAELLGNRDRSTVRALAERGMGLVAATPALRALVAS